jgi:glycolate oxidase FAD binding subunit
LGVKVTPETPEELTAILGDASTRGRVVQVRGGGTRSGFGSPPQPDISLSMSALSGIVAWEPDDLTLVVNAGTSVAEIESELSRAGQTAALPEVPGESTVGGVIAAGASSLRRARLYSVRERILEATVVTGDGRVVRSGGRVVKNVSGYDLSRLHFGAFGALGVIVSVCLKLWPTPPASATVELESVEEAARVTRPLAVLEDRGRIRLYIWGTEEEVRSLTGRFTGRVTPGLDWPADPSGPFRWSLRVPPALTGEAMRRAPRDWEAVAVHGVGEVRLASSGVADAAELRSWAESVGGRLVVVEAPPDGLGGLDPWGQPPPALGLQRALIAQFDPARIINPGRLAGGL